MPGGSRWDRVPGVNRAWILLPVWFLTAEARALGPHEVLVLANGNSADSVEVAKEYVRMRAIPEPNLVRLNLPSSVTGSPAAVTPEQFNTLILAPALGEAKKRGIAGHILAWAYSVDMPVLVKTDPEMSIQGITFLRGRTVKDEWVLKGLYLSPLFSSPDDPANRGAASQSLDVFGQWLCGDMPLPSMVLGVTGPRANTKDEVLACLRRGVESDGTAPRGTMFFVVSSDIRSTRRHWQFPTAVKELRARGVEAAITNAFPSGQKIAGLMMGAEVVTPDQGRNTYLPGCMAEHFTSFAAAFHVDNQTKLTAWLKAGATASAGTVTEPRALWPKIPSAWFYVHYVSGCTLMESFYQSVRCPLQILMVGDPLAKPWAPKGELVIKGLEAKEVSGKVNLAVRVKTDSGKSFRQYAVLMDGRLARKPESAPESGDGYGVVVDTTAVEDGPHALRIVGYSNGLVKHQVFAETRVEVRNRR